jgi:hypothetical protein
VDVPDLCHHGQPYVGPLAADEGAVVRHRDVARQSLTGWPERLDVRLAGRDPAKPASWQAVVGQFEVFGSRSASLDLGLTVARGVSATDVSVTTDVYLGSGGTQHAGVVARYRGPGDASMVSGALVTRDGIAFAEISEHDGRQWNRLASNEVGTTLGRITLRAVGRHLELSVDGRVEASALQQGEPVAGSVGVRGLRGMVGRCVVRDAEAAAVPLAKSA